MTSEFFLETIENHLFSGSFVRFENHYFLTLATHGNRVSGRAAGPWSTTPRQS
jgi:hypothetical protein